MMAKAVLRYLRMSPRKVRLVADLVRGLSLAEAVNQLAVSEKSASRPLLKLLRSALANASAKNTDKPNLIIQSITVDGGRMTKRWRARAYGRAAPIRHRTSHVTVVLGVAQKSRKDSKTALVGHSTGA